VKLFQFRGGIHPPEQKHPSADAPIRVLPLPAKLYIPVQQHVGTPAVPVVSVGQAVAKGQLLAQGQGSVTAPVHAPSSGTVVAIDDYPAPHPSGLSSRTITLETDGEDRWIETDSIADPFALDPAEVAARVGTAGVVGLGGANFPTAFKLIKARQAGIHTLIVNGAECEPYMTCDDRLMRERAAEVVDGARIMLYALQAEHAVIAIEDNKPEAIQALTEACAEYGATVSVATTPTRYPTGSAKQLTQVLTGLEVPARGRGTDTGVLVQNVGTAYAVGQAVRHGRPLVSRLVTVCGGAVAQPGNIEAPLGAPVAELLDFCGANLTEAERLLMGGPMMGQPLPNVQVPVVKGTNGVLALAVGEARARVPEAPCIRCGKCVDACPMGLMPVDMVRNIRHDNLQGAQDFGLVDCMACGSCAYVCPSQIPLVQYLEYAKGELAERQRAEQKNKEIRRIIEQKEERLAREAQAKAEAAAKRKAEREAKKKARAAAKAGADD